MADLSELRSKVEGIADRTKSEDSRELATLVIELCRAGEDIQRAAGIECARCLLPDGM
jgi:hypothetical protein